MSKIDDNLSELGIVLPTPMPPMGSYVSVQRIGNLLFFSGVGPFERGKPVYFGKLGDELTLEQGQAAARLTALNLVSILRNAVGDLDKVKQIVKLLAFVACSKDFTQQPAVVNGASDVLAEIFGERGKHARSAVSAHVLPFNIPIEIEMIVEVE
ncbi:MAG: RidA family protein [Synergistaceae bacterium]|jgi:enamine deaminase RidA (YjgF/YER057c/UK114 family)|nr:RidA family protein [Synergistaceae bacterium]